MTTFDFGLRLEYIPQAFEPQVATYLDEYITLTVLQAYYYWSVDLTTGFPVF